MGEIKSMMTVDHRRCDELLAESEAAVSKAEWSLGVDRFDTFQRAMAHHFAMEEEVLFPKFEQQAGHAGGPVQVMRMEHMQMRRLISDMSAALTDKKQAGFLGVSETMMMLMQQHNMKEEQMLYPMAEGFFGDGAAEVLEQMLQLSDGE